MEWRFERIVDAGKILNLTAARFRVQPLHIALLANRQGCRHVHLDEVLAKRADEVARFPVGRDKRRHDEHAVLLELAGQVANSFDVRVAVGPRKPGVRENVPNRIAVEPLHLEAASAQFASRPIRNRALAGAGQPGEPEDNRLDVLPFTPHPVPRPLVEPVQRDLCQKLQRSYRERQRQAAREDEYQHGGDHGAEHSPRQRLRDRPRLCLLVHRRRTKPGCRRRNGRSGAMACYSAAWRTARPPCPNDDTRNRPPPYPIPSSSRNGDRCPLSPRRPSRT